MEFHRIRDAIRAVPFRPFTVHLSDGRSFRIGHPELIAANPRTVVAFVEQGRMEVLALRHVTSLDRHDETETDDDAAA